MSRVGLMNGGGRQGWSTDAVPSSTTRTDYSGLEDYFGPPQVSLDPRANIKVTAKTLEDAYNGRNPKLTTFLVQALVNGEGWPMTFAPLTRMEMNQRIDVLEWELSSAKLTPEGGVPELVQYNESTMTTKLLRASLGAEMKSDFFNRPEGKVIFAQAVQQVVSGFWLLAKLRVSTKVTNAKEYWHLWAMDNGLPSTTLLNATRKERELFGILQKNPKGIYMVHHEATQVLSLGNSQPNMVVLPDNTFNMLALTPFETEVFRRGEVTVNQRLALGGKSMMNFFPGVTMYEDPVYRANNVPAEELTQFIKTTMTGEYFLLNQEYYDPKCDDSCADRQISTQVVDLKKDRWVTISLRDILEQNLDQRWDERTGELSSYHDHLIDNVFSIANALGIKDPGPDIDPFIWYSQDAAGSRSRGYFKARHFGDVNQTFLSMERVENVAAAIARKTRNEFSDDDFHNVNNMIQLAEDLSNPIEVDSDPAVQGLFAAISFLNGRVGAGDDETRSLKANAFGVPDLPRLAGGFLKVARGGVSYDVYHKRVTGGVERQIYYFVPDSATATAAEIVTALGGAPVTRVSAPRRPYGYGSLPGLRYLASLGRANNRGFDSWNEYFDMAEKGVFAFQKFFRLYQRIFPHTSLTDSKNLPEFLKSANDDYDRSTMLWISTIDKSPYPFMVRTWSAPAGNVNIGANPVAATWVSSPQYASSVPAGQGIPIPFGGAAETGVAASDFSSNSVGVSQVALDASLVGGTTSSDAISILVDTGVLTTRLLNALSSARSYAALNAEFVAVFGNNLNSFYRTELATVFGPTAPIAGAELLTFLIAVSSLPDFPGTLPQTSYKQKAELLRAILVMIEQNVKITKPITLEYINNLRRQAAVGAPISVDRPSPSPKADRGKIIKVSASAWANSRLVLGQAVWTTLINAGIDHFMAAIIRPANPANPLEALVGGFAFVDAAAFDATLQQQVRKNVDQFARAAHEMRKRCDPAVQAFSTYQPDWYASTRGRAIVEEARRLTNATSAWDVQGVGAYLTQSLRDVELFQLASTGPQGGDVDAASADTDVKRLVANPWLVYRLSQLEKSTSATHIRWFSRGLLFSQIHRDSVQALVREGVAPLFSCFLFYRPFIQQDMGSGLWAQGGEQTALSGFNYEDAILQLDGIHGRWTFEYHTWINCEIIDETRFIIMHDIIFRRYISGRDTVAFTNPADFRSQNPDLCKASIFVLNMGGELKREEIPDPLSITGVVSQTDFPFRVSDEASLFSRNRLQLPTYYYINLWRFHELNNNRPLVDRHTFAAQKSSNRINEIMWSGDQKFYNTADKKYSEHFSGTSHWSGLEPPLQSVVNGSTIYNPLLRSSLIKD